MKYRAPFYMFLTALAAIPVFAELVEVNLDPSLVRNIGGIEEFDRSQFVTVHESFGSADMDEADIHYLEDVLEARYGRDGGFISWMAEDIPADAANPDMPDIGAVKEKLRKFRDETEAFRLVPRHMRDVVLCAHPELTHAISNNTFTAWGPRTYEAMAEFTAQLLKHGFSDEERPRYLEVFNEPFIKAGKIGTTVEAMSEQHNVVAKRVRELNPDVLVGGYSAAWIEVEDRNFGHWNDWQKTFMDIAGENMDFWSYHVYDGVNVMGSPRSRTGSNSEAIMDLIDTYSHIRFGVAKPIMITEYGKIPRGNMEGMPYSAERSGTLLYSAMGQLMTFMDHPDRLIKVIPFFLGKATWTYGMNNEHVPGQANPFLLWRMLEDGSFVETDLSLFYKFWKGVNGEWRESTSSNPDVRVHLLADGNRLNVLLMNIDTGTKTVALSGLEEIDAVSASLRTLHTDGSKPLLSERIMEGIPGSLELNKGDAVLLTINCANAVESKATVREARFYATEYLKDIEANRPIVFTFEGVTGGKGAAVLRLSPGRAQGREPLPDRVTFNGTDLEIPTNWAGDDQKGRKNFFGMVELPVPMELVQKKNTVEILYPDSGGKVAAVVLQVNTVE